MKALKNTLVVVTIGFLLAQTSCKKTKTKKTEAPEDQPAVQEPAPGDYVPVKLQSDRLVVHIKYQEHTAFITEISDSDGYVSNISYRRKLPAQVKCYRYGIPFSYSDYEAPNDQVSSIKSFQEKGKDNVSTGYYLLSYDTQGQLTGLSYHNPGNVLLGKKNLQYSSSGNISGFDVREIPADVDAYLCTYDSKNAIFKHVSQAQLLFIVLEYPFYNYGANNPLTCLSSTTTAGNTSYTYEYNSSNYPSKLSITRGDRTQTFAITYKAL